MLLIKWFHRFIGAVYLFAFLSLFVQYPGLLSYNGILPADVFVDRLRKFSGVTSQTNNWYQFVKIPTFVAYYSEIGLPVDVICEILLYSGCLLSCLMICGVHSSEVLFLLWILYLSLYLIGMETFLSFQWDILLLETGFLAIFSSTPAFLLKDIRTFPTSTLQCFRFLAWKLMFSAGVVKLQALCPTWEKLSALEYHFATQCIPTPLGWFAHQLPPIILRIGVAGTLLIEVPLTILLLMPAVRIRRFGVLCQWMLQAFIVLTGNYNFFNLLTMILMIPAWTDAQFPLSQPIEFSFTSDNPVIMLVEFMERLNKSIYFRRMQSIFIVIFVFFSSLWMFELNFGGLSGAVWWRGTTVAVRNAFWSEALNPILQFVCVSALFFSLASVCFSVLLDVSLSISTGKERYRCSTGWMSSTYTVLQSLLRGLWDLLVGAVCVVWLFLSAKPLSSLCSIQPFIPSVLSFLTDHPYSLLHLTSGYGLFRRMTGVAESRLLTAEQQGLGLTVVARPELVLEGLDPDNTWKEIPFRYKPTDLMQAPVFVAPHQPRLDWQMWFAALGNYESNPWLVHLVLKLLYPHHTEEGTDKQRVAQKSSSSGYFSPDIWNLLDSERYPFNLSSPPTAIRVTLFEYDFTRWNTSWSAHLADIDSKAIIIPTKNVKLNSSDSDNLSHSERQQWWWRRNGKEYLPAIGLQHQKEVKKFLLNHGIKVRKYRSVQKQYELCVDPGNNFQPEKVLVSSRKVREALCSVVFLRAQMKNLNPSYYPYHIISTSLVGLMVFLFIRNKTKIKK